MGKSTKRIDIKPLYLDEEMFNLLIGGKEYAFQIKEQRRTEVILGYSSRPEDELNIPNILKDNVKIFRRKGGGCSVVLLEGMIIISVGYKTLMYHGFTEAMQMINSRIIRALTSAGIINVSIAGVSDLVINAKKILGCSLYKGKEFSIYHGSLVIDSDLSLVDRYLKHPPREPEYRKGRKHSEFMTNLSSEHPWINKDLLKRNLLKNMAKPFWV